MRVEQVIGEKGSLKWIQRAVAERWSELEQPILSRLRAAEIEWLSPLGSDGFAEYRDGAFLTRVGLSHLTDDLAVFWPRRGPQWDALGRSGAGDILLVEAKAHVGEMCSPASQAGPDSRLQIERSLRAAAIALGAANSDLWPRLFYQLANRIAFLWFLRERGVPAYLLLVNFIGDTEREGPSSEEAWDAAYTVAFHALGLPKRHRLSPFIIHAFPRVRA